MCTALIVIHSPTHISVAKVLLCFAVSPLLDWCTEKPYFRPKKRHWMYAGETWTQSLTDSMAKSASALRLFALDYVYLPIWISVCFCIYIGKYYNILLRTLNRNFLHSLCIHNYHNVFYIYTTLMSIVTLKGVWHEYWISQSKQQTYNWSTSSVYELVIP